MFERYTERARRVIFFARHETSQLGGSAIESGHVLLGLIREDKSLTNRFRSSALESIRSEIEERSTGQQKFPTSTDLPLSDECQRILAYANEEADRLKHRHIGTEHLLLGILREEKCVAAEILFSRGLRLEALREELVAHSAAESRQKTNFLSLTSMGDGMFDSKALFAALERHGFTSSKEHLLSALAGYNLRGDQNAAHAELQLFLESLIDAMKERLDGADVALPIFEGFDSRVTLRGLRTGLPVDDDWKFRWWLTLLLAEVLLKRFEQRLDS